MGVDLETGRLNVKSSRARVSEKCSQCKGVRISGMGIAARRVDGFGLGHHSSLSLLTLDKAPSAKPSYMCERTRDPEGVALTSFLSHSRRDSQKGEGVTSTSSNPD